MKIIGTGSALPSLSVTNEMLSIFLDTSDEWIRTRTGIQERRIISDENLKDLAVQAAQKALDEAGISGSELDYIICSNVVNYYVTPSLSCLIAGGIQAACPCVDLNAACSGFIYGLDMAQAYIMTGKAKKHPGNLRRRTHPHVQLERQKHLCSVRGWGRSRSCNAGGRIQGIVDNCRTPSRDPLLPKAA